ncbi:MULTISPECIES: serine hydrolase domain-containing protein [Bacillaceae]|uniref:Beta-lactamase family protein n=1 Tax=Evansella alkalicola TaxID=745819 RepID=A0ABS6JNW8_9BACI|nr:MULTISPECIES: serine hydrolase domain-containing protein [Bacillaceae]MBU9720259.1 beta-lactamase family protein [Bacillus alkalicola]
MKELSKQLSPLLKSFVEKGPTGCALSVSHNGRNVFKEYVGFADVEKGKEITEDTIYRIFSMTKVVTCTAALMLYERGLFLLNDPIETYLPEFSEPKFFQKNDSGEATIVSATRSIQVKDLFTMTSGLTYEGDGDPTEREVKKVREAFKKKQEQGEKVTVRDLTKAVASIPLAFDPGTQWRYGLSHDVLGSLVEVISGKTLGEFFEEEIFTPLGMNDTFFQLPEDKKHRFAQMYLKNDAGNLDPWGVLDSHYAPDAAFESGGAGLLSTINDYSRFAELLANGGELDGVRLLGKKTVELMTTNHLSPDVLAHYNWPYLAGYGYGLGVRTMMDPVAGGINGSIGEFGWSGLAGTWVMIDPKEKLSAVYMQQLLPNLEEYHQPRLRNVIYGAI